MRLKHLDFLRGIAVLLVLFRHYSLADILYQIGWIGVDLFFVLSGFLVSGLLFNEYKKFQNIKPILFLIRRGLKIYPLFYSVLIFTVFVALIFNYLGWTSFDVFRGALLSEFIFMQNYLGHVWDHTWSLAVEEHFYFLLVVLIFFLTRKKIIENRKNFTLFFLFIAISCLSMRFLTNLYLAFDNNTHVYPTHLRIDSLMFGVFLSYNYNFFKVEFISFFEKNRKLLLIISACFVSTPFFFPLNTFFMCTIGFTLLYLGFGIIMSEMLISKNTISKLNRVLGKRIVDIISKIGFYSYSIYLWHMIVLIYLFIIVQNVITFKIPNYILFLAYFFLSIFIAIGTSKLIEQRFLVYRDKKYPSRTKEII